ncbi:MerR family transcriptional regulator [Pseudoclavibacter endophyticus]|uniref:MerR family transcriptional regulator n=1 Tax=Pseudoclavibacter endophyticus TaxID=1778590 RepID=A0A6H9WG19_9MICO|nr:MerR family transcriptional regulator [Pseudoclavibacter endophyticus]KAB1649842.1 MerR family transcriptional regulator [Pseudoclavibacter endophyticus]GGA59348.1 MerR family transcriptional regulator [Pseudoclavibacter endophyticus]
MHSGQLARLAGVTVRALRHYHQVGVLAEPDRRSNGYREYDVHDLIRVLRIKRLASLGIPLHRMPDLLDDTKNDAGELLDELDAELATRIEHLARQRDIIARIRDSDAAPDLPPELAPFLAGFAAGLSPELAKFDRDQAVLLAHLAGEDQLPHITRFYKRLSNPDLASAVADISERFGRLGPDSTEQDIAELIDSVAINFTSVIEELAASDPPLDISATADIFAEYATDLLNEQQRRTLEKLERRLNESRAT